MQSVHCEKQRNSATQPEGHFLMAHFDYAQVSTHFDSEMLERLSLIILPFIYLFIFNFVYSKEITRVYIMHCCFPNYERRLFWFTMPS